MVGNTPVALDSLPCAREILRELDSEESAPPLYLIRGRSGTGKSVLLGAIRARLRARGTALTDIAGDVVARRQAQDTASLLAAEDLVTVGGARLHAVGSSRATGRNRLALIVDDAHGLSQEAFETLYAAIESGVCTVVVATRPAPHDARLRTLADLVARRGKVVDLRALGATEIAPFARELGMMVPRGLGQHIHQQTGGIHGGVVAALTAACATRLESGIAAVDEAVAAWARARLDDADPELLDTFVVAAVGAGLDTSELTEVLDITHTVAQDLVDRARGSALVTDADLLLTPAIAPLRTLVGDRRQLAVQRRLLRARLDAGLLRDHTALLLAESGVRDQRLAEFLCTAAEKAGDEAPRHYAAAAAAGADPAVIAVRWADAAARAGDCDAALHLAEPALARESTTPTDLAAAVRVCAGVWTRRALVPRAAQLYTWLGPGRVGTDWAVAATVLYLAGDAATARALAATASQWPPTEATARAALIADALAGSVTRSPESGRGAAVTAASALIHAAHSGIGPAENRGDRFLPCSAVSIAALLCLSMGEPRRAADALRGAARDPQSLVLSAWVAMLGGDEQSAAAVIAELDVSTLDARDRLLAHGVIVGLARRSGDHTALVLAWQAAYPLFDEVSADLLALLPIGELWLAGIRLRDESRVTALVDAAAELLRRLGDPPAWANAFHWYAIQASIAHESPHDLIPHAQQLKSAAAAGDPQAAALADAGRTWVLVLRGQVERAQVEAAVARLTALGLIWDAARLASEAALVAADSAVATALLKLARTVRAQARPPESPVRTPALPTPAPRPEPLADTVLSEREREVAELVLLGLTYREIGARLYISAKTVEHHVARIRRRIGANSRSELLSMLRAMGHGSLLV